ncbi:MAG: DUF4054 domain-containing protein [Elusimicrobiaceae bacterium]|nr:DUF4054 domain-containing protein [Elusimicrobiaceae bacterium]
MAGNIVTVTVEGMRLQLPYFKNAEKYPDEVLAADLELAQCYISPLSCGPLKEACRARAVYLMAGHLQVLTDRINGGNMGTGLQTGASVDKVSITLTPPPSKDQYDYWLNLTPFGADLLFLLNSFAPLGFYFGGSNENVFR